MRGGPPRGCSCSKPRSSARSTWTGVDNVCHTLVGAAFGQAGLRRCTRYGTATLMIASNIPDLDVLVFFSGTPSLSFRRGWTHGVLAQLLLPVLLTAVVWVAGRWRGAAGRGEEDPPLRPGWVLLLSYV